LKEEPGHPVAEEAIITRNAMKIVMVVDIMVAASKIDLLGIVENTVPITDPSINIHLVDQQ
jgi:hypothetical protein